MRALELFVSRPPEQEAKLHLMELKAELSLPSGAREQEVKEKFFDFIDRAIARFEFSTSKYLSAAEADLPRMWVQFKGLLLGIEEGPGSLFLPAIRNNSGTARSDLAQLFGAVERLVPVTEKIHDRIDALREEIKRHDIMYTEDEQRLWFAASSQARRFETHAPAFISPEEEKMIRIFESRARSVAGQPNDVRELEHLGETNLVWRTIKGALKPCFRDGRYSNSSIFLSPVYLRICRGRLPEGQRGAMQQRKILDGALAVVEGVGAHG